MYPDQKNRHVLKSSHFEIFLQWVKFKIYHVFLSIYMYSKFSVSFTRHYIFFKNN